MQQGIQFETELHLFFAIMIQTFPDSLVLIFKIRIGFFAQSPDKSGLALAQKAVQVIDDTLAMILTRIGMAIVPWLLTLATLKSPKEIIPVFEINYNFFFFAYL